MKTARLVRRLEDWQGDARLYELSEPVEGTRLVTVSATSRYSVETYIFPTDESGEPTSWGELPGSFRGGMDHARALRGLGFEVVS